MKENSINISAVPSWAHTRLGRAGRKSAFSEVPGTLLVDFQRIRNQQRALGQYFSNFGICPAGGRPMNRANEMDLISSPGCGCSLMLLLKGLCKMCHVCCWHGHHERFCGEELCFYWH